MFHLPNWIIGQGLVVVEGYPVQYVLLYREDSHQQKDVIVSEYSWRYHLCTEETLKDPQVQFPVVYTRLNWKCMRKSVPFRTTH